jgi:predicted XRE-type DNA-binding protein
MKKNKDYNESSGNVFKDLELPYPEESLAKAELAYQVNLLIAEKKLTQAQAAQLLGIDQPKISALKTGRLSGFSLERLFRLLNILDQDIVIKITPKKTSRTKSKVTVISKIQKTLLPKRSPTSSTAKSYQAKKKK